MFLKITDANRIYNKSFYSILATLKANKQDYFIDLYFKYDTKENKWFVNIKEIHNIIGFIDNNVSIASTRYDTQKKFESIYFELSEKISDDRIIQLINKKKMNEWKAKKMLNIYFCNGLELDKQLMIKLLYDVKRKLEKTGYQGRFV